MRAWVKWVLFINAYTPFFLILLIRDLKAGTGFPSGGLSLYTSWHLFTKPLFSWTVLVLLVLSNLFLILFLKGFYLARDPLPDFKSSTSKAAEPLNYIVTYIIPFLEFNTERDLVPLLILLMVIGIVYVHSNLLSTNPMLSFAGYKAYELSSDGKDSFILITKKTRKELEAKMPVVQVADDIYLEVRR